MGDGSGAVGVLLVGVGWLTAVVVAVATAGGRSVKVGTTAAAVTVGNRSAAPLPTRWEKVRNAIPTAKAKIAMATMRRTQIHRREVQAG